jgi:hypothetical protein
MVELVGMSSLTDGLRLLPFAGWLMLAAPAWAHLGGAYASVDVDRASLGARLQSVVLSTHTVHTLTLANGGIVREYSRGDGAVFAVTWRAPGRPDLRQLLGDHFATLQADNGAPLRRRTRAPLVVTRSDFVVQTGGHSGAFWGVAVLPQMEPAGFSATDLR